eukprot:gene2428-3158_t
MDSGMTQYKTHWRQGVETIVTWSLKDTINRYGAGGDTEDLAEVLLRDMEAREAAKSDEKVGHAEIVMERPTGEHRNWPGVQRLDIQHGEINPDEDIYPGTAEQAQLRTEGETSYSYNDKGRLVGKIATRKLSRLYKRYASKINLRPWQQHETPTNPKGLRGKEVGERRRSMEDMVEAWWTYQNYPGEVQKPTVQEAMDDNEEGSRGDIRRKAVQRWKATFQETVIYPDTFRSLKGEHEPGRKGATWGKRWEKEKGAIRRHKYNTGTILQELGRTLTTEPETWKRKEVPQPTGGTAKSSANGEQEVSVEEATEEDREAIERAVEEEIQEDNRRLVRDAERREADDKMRKEMEFHEWIDERTEEEQWEVGANEEEQREEEFHRWIDEEMSRVGRMNEDCPKVEMTEEWVGDEQEVGEEEVAQEWPRDRARETISYKAGETDEQEVERIKRDMEGVTLEE